MIGTIDIRLQAANPQMPISPLMAFVNSPSSVRLRDVPKQIGNWNITQVIIQATYPDNSTKSATCVRNGNIWVGTIDGSTVSGSSTDGFVVYANGIDENGDARNGYVLGKGDIYVYTVEGQIEPETMTYKVRWYDTTPTNPQIGDCTYKDGQIQIYNGTVWKGTTVPTKTSQLTNDSGFITIDDVPPSDKLYSPDETRYIQGDLDIYRIDEEYEYFIVNDNALVEDDPTHAGADREWVWENPHDQEIKMYITVSSPDEEGMAVWKFYDVDGSETVKSGETYTPHNIRFKKSNNVYVWAYFKEEGSVNVYDGHLAKTNQIPTKTSQLTNDSGFLTQHQSLANYVTLNTTQTISGTKTISGANLNVAPDFGLADTETLNWILAKGKSGSYGYNNKPMVYVGLKDSYMMLRGIGTRPMYRYHTDLNNYTLKYLALTDDIPTKVSQLTNDQNYVSQFSSTDGDMCYIGPNRQGNIYIFASDDPTESFIKIAGYEVATQQYVDEKLGDIETILATING